VLAALTCALLLPFTGKAFHIDDPLFLWTAQHVREHPLDFYGFDVNWYGWKEPISDIAQNPPLVSYYAALVGAVFGFGERAMHVAFFVPAAFLLVGTWRLATRFSSQPVLAALIALATPAVFVSSTSIMCDVSMLCLWVWAVVFWVESIDERCASRMGGALALIAGASLTKYFGMCLVPLLAAYALALGERRRVAWLLVPVAVLAAYQLWTSRIYGHGLLFQAAQYASEQRGRDAYPLGVSLLLGLGFTGGCMMPIVCFAHRLWSKRAMLVLVAFGIAAAVLVASIPLRSQESLEVSELARFGISAQMALWCAAGAGVVLLCVEDWRARRDPSSILLGLWVLGTFAFACFVNWTTNARSMLPMAPAVAILIARRLGARGEQRCGARAGIGSEHATWRALVPLVPALCVSLCFAWADAELADSARAAASEIDARYPTSSYRLYFEGHWGFQHYMQALKREPLDFKTFHLAPGDLLVAPHNNVGHYVLPEKTREIVETLKFPAATWLSTMNARVGAAFYAGNMGLLPFIVAPIPSERYSVLRIVRPIAARP
jgi:hypothetical protein